MVRDVNPLRPCRVALIYARCYTEGHGRGQVFHLSHSQCTELHAATDVDIHTAGEPQERVDVTERTRAFMRAWYLAIASDVACEAP